MSSDAAPLQPKSILRGHKAQVHAASFVRCNDRLATGDADGFVILWDLTIMRPRAVWQAHTNAILGITSWGCDRIITHGRDNKLIVWKLAAEDEPRMSTALPLDPSSPSRPRPWMLHLLEVNTMNFCSFSSCRAELSEDPPPGELLIAVPNTLASEAIDVFHLPSQQRRHTVKLGGNNGMVMALRIFYHEGALTLAAGYENGLATVARLEDGGSWAVTYRAQCHSQPILSLDVNVNDAYFLTSGADVVIVKHPIPTRILKHEHGLITDSTDSSRDEKVTPEEVQDRKKPATGTSTSLLSAALAAQPTPSPLISPSSMIAVDTQPIKVVNTKHSGQQSLRIRSDARIFATGGWDSRVRVYSTKTLREVAVLKWHQLGCYAVAFSDVDENSVNLGNMQRGSLEPSNPDQLRPGPANTSAGLVPKLVEVTVRDRRVMQAKTAHWLAAGSKDGKVSVWDVF
ncbi:WD domain-containing protein [Pleurostoma richardsiae]|uniref:ASTRA-associated protein 1 n=1 Tax=Pleurostoma richardsiae TaxID=41990 RepID=A0AA38VRX8_9PEZI|nr:WD domain-containing protein [Pleurostoma richardsiae]